MLKRRIGLTVFVIGILLALIFFAWQYIFQIYEVKAELSKDKIECSSSDNIELTVYPLNSFGKKIPLRSVDVEIEFETGEELVETILLNNSEINAVFKPLGKSGTVNVIVKCKFSFAPIRLSFSLVE